MQFQDEHDDRINFAERDAANFFNRIDILVRMYEIVFQLNGMTTTQYVITTSGGIDATHRLETQYRRADIRVLSVALTALAWRWVHERGDLSELRAHNNLTGRTVRRGSYEWWTSDSLAAARRIASGKPLEPVDPQRGTNPAVAGWVFKHVRRVLRQDRGEGFVRQEVAQMFPPELRVELPEIIRRLTVLGYLTERSPGWWRITPKGSRLREQSQRRFSQERALALIKDLKHRIAAVNADPKYVYKVKAAIVFGSALNEGERVGDVDVALHFVPRHSNREKHAAAFQAARDRAPSHVRGTIFTHVTWPLNEAQAALVGPGRGRISPRNVDELVRIFEEEPVPPKYSVIFGSWTPPARPRRRRVSVGTPATQLMKKLALGGVLSRLRGGERERHSIGSIPIDENLIEELIQVGAFIDSRPSSHAELITDEWVLSAAAYAAIERGFFLLRQHRRA